MFSGIQKHHGGTTMTELEKAANDFFPIDEKTMSLDEQSDQLLRQIGFKFCANWQKEQFEKDYTNLCNGIATAKGIAVTMAYDKGMADARKAVEIAREEVIEKAVKWLEPRFKNYAGHYFCNVLIKEFNILLN